MKYVVRLDNGFDLRHNEEYERYFSGDRLMVAAPMNHICLDDREIAYLAGSRIKVQQIVIAHYDLNRSPEQIKEDYPHLSLAQVYAALAYYHDHRAKIDAEIAESDRFAEEMRTKNPNPLTREQLEARIRQKDTAG